MSDHQQQFLLNDLLRDVSRSFFITLRVLPSGMREPISIAYLLARAADTIADTSLVAAQARLDLLTQLRDVLETGEGIACFQDNLLKVIEQQQDNHEQVLLQRLSQVLALLDLLTEADRRQVIGVVMTLTSGMLWDMQTFPDESSGELLALPDAASLDRYTYMVAGCVGEFWSDISFAHDRRLAHWDLPQQRELGIRFGKALQLTNILRDLPEDLRIGRCYLPQQELVELGLTAQSLLDAKSSAPLQPLYNQWLAVAVGHYAAAQQYIAKIPRRCYLLRLACLWPVMIGLKTLQRLQVADQRLNPEVRIKIRRSEVYGLIITSLPMAFSKQLTDTWLARNIKKISDGLNT